jgi:hypothetical protein
VPAFYVNQLLRCYRRSLLTDSIRPNRIVRKLLCFFGASRETSNLEYWCARQLAPGSIGSIDSVVASQGMLLIRGWILAFDHEIVELTISMNSNLKANATLQQQRPDVTSSFPGETYAYRSGFSACLPTLQTQIEPNIKLMAAARLRNGSTITGEFAACSLTLEEQHPISKFEVNFG